MLPSVNKNIAFNYGGQLYSTLIGIIVLPLFLEHVGAEAYGLIGFYTLVQAWMTMLDMGMTPTLGREVARLRGDPNESRRLVTIVNSLESVFLGIAAIFAIIFLMGRGWLSSSWLTVETLPLSTVQNIVSIIGVTVAIRWISSLSRSGINAYEHQGWLNVFEVIVNTLRFPVALFLIIQLHGNVLAFFYFQLAIVLLEVVILRVKLRKLLPNVPAPRFCWSTLRRIIPFAMSIAYTAAIWVLLTQIDKLVLSKTLTLAEYGYFTLVATISAGVMMFSNPISKAILPRMTALASKGEYENLIRLYRMATRIIVILVMPVALTVAFMPYRVLFAWTGNGAASEWGQPILPLFTMGAAVLGLVAFQYYLQYAYGNLKYHVRYNTISVLLNTPLIIFSAIQYGAIGVAWVWFGFRFISFIVWVPFIHKKFAPGLHKKWLLEDIFFPLILIGSTISVGVYISSKLGDISRMDQVILLSVICVSATIVAASGVFWNGVRSRFSG